MKLFTKHVTVHKSYDEICKIVRACAYKDQCEFTDHTFSLHSAKRSGRNQIITVPLKGTVTELENGADVCIELHANGYVYLGMLFMAVGVMRMLIAGLLCLFGLDIIWYKGVMDVVFGIVVAGLFALRSVEHVDLLEHKLTLE